MLSLFAAKEVLSGVRVRAAGYLLRDVQHQSRACWFFLVLLCGSSTSILVSPRFGSTVESPSFDKTVDSSSLRMYSENIFPGVRG